MLHYSINSPERHHLFLFLLSFHLQWISRGCRQPLFFHYRRPRQSLLTNAETPPTLLLGSSSHFYFRVFCFSILPKGNLLLLFPSTSWKKNATYSFLTAYLSHFLRLKAVWAHNFIPSTLFLVSNFIFHPLPGRFPPCLLSIDFYSLTSLFRMALTNLSLVLGWPLPLSIFLMLSTLAGTSFSSTSLYLVASFLALFDRFNFSCVTSVLAWLFLTNLFAHFEFSARIFS